MKNYCVEVSFTGKCYIYLEAENKEMAQKKALEAASLHVESDNKDIDVSEWEWDFIIEEQGGNVKEAYISDIEVYEV